MWTTEEVLEPKPEPYTIEDTSRESVLALKSEYPRPLSTHFEQWLESAALVEHTLEGSEPVAMEVTQSTLELPDTEAPSPDTPGATDTVDDTLSTWFSPGDVIGQ